MSDAARSLKWLADQLESQVGPEADQWRELLALLLRGDKAKFEAALGFAPSATRHGSNRAADVAPDIDDDLLELPDAARRFGVLDDTLRSWCRLYGVGEKPHGRWLVSISRVQERIRSRR